MCQLASARGGLGGGGRGGDRGGGGGLSPLLAGLGQLERAPPPVHSRLRALRRGQLLGVGLVSARRRPALGLAVLHVCTGGVTSNPHSMVRATHAGPVQRRGCLAGPALHERPRPSPFHFFVHFFSSSIQDSEQLRGPMPCQRLIDPD